MAIAQRKSGNQGNVSEATTYVLCVAVIKEDGLQIIIWKKISYVGCRVASSNSYSYS